MFVINPIQFLFSDVCHMRHHDSEVLKSVSRTFVSIQTFAGLMGREPRESGMMRIKSTRCDKFFEVTWGVKKVLGSMSKSRDILTL